MESLTGRRTEGFIGPLPEGPPGPRRVQKPDGRTSKGSNRRPYNERFSFALCIILKYFVSQNNEREPLTILRKIEKREPSSLLSQFYLTEPFRFKEGINDNDSWPVRVFHFIKAGIFPPIKFRVGTGTAHIVRMKYSRFL